MRADAGGAGAGRCDNAGREGRRGAEQGEGEADLTNHFKSPSELIGWANNARNRVRIMSGVQRSVILRRAGTGSGSFLKKRTKKLFLFR
jgi:hypothetical protein